MKALTYIKLVRERMQKGNNDARLAAWYLIESIVRGQNGVKPHVYVEHFGKEVPKLAGRYIGEADLAPGELQLYKVWLCG